MKKFFLMLSSVFLFVGMVHAQDTTSKQEKQQSIQKPDRIHLEEHLIYQGGKLYWVRNGMLAEIKNQIMLNNGGNLYQNQEMFNRGRMIDKTETIRNFNITKHLS